MNLNLYSGQLPETNEELRAHIEHLLSKIDKNKPRHEEIDLDVEGAELI